MDLVISRFPHIGKNILNNLDNESLVNCKEVGRALSNFLEEEKIVWIRGIRNYTNQFQNKKFRESWRLVIQKTNSELIKQLATVLKDSIYKHENQIMYGAYLRRGKRMWHPLHIAVESGNLDLCQFIFGRAKIKNPLDIELWTPLHSAAKFGHFEIWQMIFKRVKNKNPPTKSLKTTPLHLAAHSGHLKICKAIVKKLNKIDHGPKDHDGKTPFHLAAEEGHLEVCLAILFSSFENKTRQAKFGVFIEGYCDIMCDKFDRVSLRDFSGNTPLHTAAFQGHLTIVKELIASLSYKHLKETENYNRKTPFHLAAEEGHLDVCLALLEEKKNKNRGDIFGIFLEAYCDTMSKKYNKRSLRNFSGDAPLLIAAFKGHLSIVKEIMANFSYKHLEGTGDFTPLHAAACNGHFKVCLEIMKNIEDKNPQDTRGTTPLHYAAYYGHLQICEAIMDELTDKNPSNKLGLTPMDMAKFTFQINVVEAIENKMKMEMREHQK